MKIKSIFIKTLCALALLFTFGLFLSFTIEANAEELTTTTNDETTTTIVEETTTIEDEEGSNAVDTILAWLKNTNIDTLRNGIIGLGAYLGISYLTILSVCIVLIKEAIKRTKENEKFKELEAKLTAQQKQDLNNAMDSFNNSMDAMMDKINNIIINSDEEKKKLALETTKQVSQKLNELTAQIEAVKSTTSITDTTNE